MRQGLTPVNVVTLTVSYMSRLIPEEAGGAEQRQGFILWDCLVPGIALWVNPSSLLTTPHPSSKQTTNKPAGAPGSSEAASGPGLSLLLSCSQPWIVLRNDKKPVSTRTSIKIVWTKTYSMVFLFCSLETLTLLSNTGTLPIVMNLEYVFLPLERLRLKYIMLDSLTIFITLL